MHMNIHKHIHLAREEQEEREKQKRFWVLLSYLNDSPQSPLQKSLRDRSSFHSYEAHRPKINGEIEETIM